MDPIGERGGVNLYGFVGNNGVGSVDALGLIIILDVTGANTLNGGRANQGEIIGGEDELRGLHRDEEGIEEILEDLNIGIEKLPAGRRWSVRLTGKHVIQEGDSKSPEHRKSVLAHEVIAYWFVKHAGISEGHRPGDYTGTHNLAMAAELALLAQLDSSQCNCAHAKDRLGEAHLVDGEGQAVWWSDEVKQLVAFICACEMGEAEGKVHEKKFISDTYGWFDKKLLWMKYRLECDDRKIKSTFSIAEFD